MINFWRVANGMWAFAFMAQDAEEADKKARIQRFRRFLRIEQKTAAFCDSILRMNRQSRQRKASALQV